MQINIITPVSPKEKTIIEQIVENYSAGQMKALVEVSSPQPDRHSLKVTLLSSTTYTATMLEVVTDADYSVISVNKV